MAWNLVDNITGPQGPPGPTDWTEGDTRYVNVPGDTMTGPLILPTGLWHDAGAITPLMVGPQADAHLQVSNSGIQSRSPGGTGINPLWLNEYGGQVVVGIDGMEIRGGVDIINGGSLYIDNPGGLHVEGGFFPNASYVKDFDVQGQAIIENGLEVTGGDVLLNRDPTSALQAATKQYVDAHAGAWSPGDMKMIAYATPDPGWLLCDGAAVSRTTYSALFAKIGTAYGVGDNLNTFNVPNLKGRAAFMMDATVALFNALGKTGGTRDAVVASHSHGLSNHTHNTPHTHTINHDHAQATSSTAGSHQHTFDQDNTSGTSSATISRGRATPVYTGVGGFHAAAGDHAHTVNLAAFTGTSGSASAAASGGPSDNNSQIVGVSPTDANVPPFGVINYVIKT